MVRPGWIITEQGITGQTWAGGCHLIGALSQRPCRILTSPIHRHLIYMGTCEIIRLAILTLMGTAPNVSSCWGGLSESNLAYGLVAAFTFTCRKRLLMQNIKRRREGFT